CLAAGAAMLHLHVRDQDGGHLLDAQAYREAIDAVRGAVGDDMVLQITAEAVGRYTPDEQISLVRKVHPEAASVALKELTADGEEKASAFYRWALNEGIALQHILYTPDEVRQLADMVARKAISGENLSVLYVLGRYGNGQSQPGDLLAFLNAADDAKLQPKMWSVCAFGAAEGAVALTAMSLGGHVRVGFENNVFLNNKMVAPNNAALVKQVAYGAKLLSRPVSSAHQARAYMLTGDGGGI
ncbi:MAG: 3-keto-5-aminohexanoate cleavage protein, partial [Magnetovibrio sp.]|nr:3-keto-5-aminohexanoate cleavage protein [Magnetovibrio sp.]